MSRVLVPLLLLAPSLAFARPLTLAEIDELSAWLDCGDACDAGPADNVQVCRRTCGAVKDLWEKDGVPPVGRRDLELARLEYADAGRGTEICYRDNGNVVMPAALCPGALCLSTPACSAGDCAAPEAARPPTCPDLVCRAAPVRDAANCADGGDGIPQWIRNYAGRAGAPAGGACQTDADCDFRHACSLDPAAMLPLCLSRTCATACTAFHLELKSVDDQQALVNVVYDYSPVPARVLDLRIEYDRLNLLLQDARPLPNLTGFGKRLAVGHTSTGVLRLTVYDMASSDPVPTGPIVELVFQRIGDGAANVSFSTNPTQMTAAIAPLQGDQSRQGDLSDAALWGPPVTVPGRVQEWDRRLLLWYGFESDATPLSYSNVLDGDALCAGVPVCSLETDAQQRARVTARLSALQSGRVASAGRIEGVVRDGAYLDGSGHHLELPVQVLDPLVASGQSFSYAMWFYTEGNTSTETAGEPQILFSHNGPDERTHFGLVTDFAQDGTAEVSFFVGDLASGHRAARTSLAAGLALRTWHHVGFALNAVTGDVQLYFDGSAAGSVLLTTIPPSIVCPAFANGSDVILHEEGDFMGGRPPESIWFADRVNGLFSIRRTDPSALMTVPVVADPGHSFRDVDVSPNLGLIAYASDAGGSSEIWIANLDGSAPRQLTMRFGDTARGIEARRPRWAPDGSALLFESNVYSLPDGHNTSRGFQLYFVGFDPVQRVVSTELDGGVKVSQLDYDALIASQSLGAVQLTRSDGNHQNGWWLKGRGSGGTRGIVLFDSSDTMFKAHAVTRLDVMQNIRDSSVQTVPSLAGNTEEARLLAAFRQGRPGATPPETVQVLHDRSSTTYPVSTQYTAGAVEGGASATVTVRFAPTGYGADCWDRSRDHVRDTDEDANQDGVWDVRDCYPNEIHDLYVAFDPGVYQPRLTPADAADAAQGTVEAAMGRQLVLTETSGKSGSFVRVEVKSAYGDALPLTPGLLATLKFDRRNPGTASPAFAARQRRHDSKVFVANLSTGAAPAAVDLAGLLDDVQAGVFSPEGSRLLLYGTSHSRPQIVRSLGLTTLAGGTRVGGKPELIEGLVWVREERYYPCNWVGAFLHPSSKQYTMALHGGVDEVKLWAGLRVPEAFASDAAIGFERLVRDGRAGQLPSLLPACGMSNLDCPPYYACVNSRCTMVACDPTDAYSCVSAGGRCSMRPASVKQENPGFGFVCSSDCASDQQCFTQTCLNGPCRFCDVTTLTCMECRDAVKDYGSFQVRTVEGCPDSNAFYCASGACRTECFAFVDGRSIALCDPTLEYCSHGRCLLRDWDWPDFAPGSFGGLSETIYDKLPGGIRRTVALGEMVSVTIKAYGVSDRNIPPELVLEGKFEASDGALYGGNWFRIGKVFVDNRTRVEAETNPYVFEVPHPISSLRARLIQSPYRNLDYAATGLGLADKDFCLNDLALSVAQGGGTIDTNRCRNRPPGSSFYLGYGGDIPDYLAAADCAASGASGCPRLTDSLRQYLLGGYPAVIVTEAQVRSAIAPILTNMACSYEGTTQPVEPGTGRPRLLFYGDVTLEDSPATAAFCAANGCQTTGLVDFTAASGGAWGLLNCNYTDVTGISAQVEFAVPPYVQALTNGTITETANACLVELDQNRTELCYEWMGGDVSFDPVNGDIDVFRTLEFSIPKGFAHDRGYTSAPAPSFPLAAAISGLTAGSVVVSNGTEQVTLTASQPSATFAMQVGQGRRYAVKLVSQPPPIGGTLCAVDATTGKGRMPTGGATARVVCGPVVTLGGTATGIAGDRVLLRLATDQYVAGNAVAARGRFELEVRQNGPFKFAAPLLEGSAWSAYVAGEPRTPTETCTLTPTKGILPAGGANSLVVRCSIVVPRLLSVSVSGLPAGDSITLVNSATNESITRNADGTFPFAQKVAPGRAYSVTITAGPTTLGTSCAVDNPSGTMPNQDTSVAVLCTSRPTYTVSVTTTGLRGKNLSLSLSGSETLAIAADGTRSFAKRLLDAASYSVAVATQPILPDQTCQVVNGSGTIQGANASAQVVCTQVISSTSYAVGGTVSGLNGTGLKLTNRGADVVDIARNGAFAFMTPLPAGSVYEVSVAQQPLLPMQSCSVSNGSGTVASADVVDIGVVCVDATAVTLRVGAVGASPLAVRAMLVSKTTGKVVARSADGAEVPAGGGDVRMVEPSRVADQGAAPRATFPAGQYQLYALLNVNETEDDQGHQIWTPNNPGLSVTLTTTSGQELVKSLSLSGFVATVAPPIEMTAGSLAAGDSARCYWTHATGSQPPVPPRVDTPVVATSLLVCPQGLKCWTSGKGTTGVREPLVAGTYDLTCWVDMGTAGAKPDGSLDAPDYIGFKANVSVTASQQSITLAGAQ